MSDIRSNIALIRDRIQMAAERSGRDPARVKLIAAIKGVPREMIETAIESGMIDLGENRVQEARSRSSDLKSKYPGTVWHMIGHLQTNKIKQALEIFDIIQTVDSIRLAEEINKLSGIRGKVSEVFFEVNISGEAQKFGVPESQAESLVRHAAGLKNLLVSGLMTVPPYSADPEDSRPFFKRLRSLYEKLNGLGFTSIKHLSMGMSDDLEVAVEEGATIVRVGRGIFGVEHRH